MTILGEITGKDLQVLRVSADLTQQKLAERLGKGGYSAKVIGGIENGRRPIGSKLVRAWATACNCEVSVQTTFRPITQESA